MKDKKRNLIIFLGCLLSLIISLKLFWNMGIYVDEMNTSPHVVCGGEFWLYMNWLRLLFLGIVTFLSGINLFIDNQQEKK